MVAVIAEGDSIAVQMQPAITQQVDVQAYDAFPGRPVHEGVRRLIARRDLHGRPVFVSLGSADYLFKTANAVTIAHEARVLLRHADCVVWKLIRVERGPWGDTGDGGEALNRGLRRVKRLHLVRAVKPDAGDGLHFAAAGAAAQARLMVRAARRYC